MLNCVAHVSRQLVRLLVLCLVGAGLAACSGSDSLGDFGGNGGGTPGEAPTATVSPNGGLGMKQDITVTFSEPMNAESVQLGGSLSDVAAARWSSGDTVLTLSPESSWPAGAQTLEVDGSDTDDDEMETLSVEFTVRTTFADFQEAAVVIGQADFSGGTANQSGGIDANTLDQPVGATGFSVDEDTLFVSDTGSSRVLGFNGLPTENNANGDFVIGQSDFTSDVSDTTAANMRTPQRVTATNGKLIVTDRESHRVLIYDSVPVSGPQDADVVLGQASMTARETQCSATSLNNPESHFVTPDGKLLVADSGHNRVLVWNEIPTENGAPPDIVLGQGNFEVCQPNDDDMDGTFSPDWPPHANTMSYPTGIWSDGEKLIVADSGNHRVLIWSEFPTESFAEADQVLGQNSFRSMTPNDDDQDHVTDASGEASSRVFNFPFGVWSDGAQIFVADRDNNRVLIWNEYPDRFFPSAAAVLGQENFNNNAANDQDQDGSSDDAPNAATLNQPTGVRLVDDRLVITDTGNSRVLLYESE